MHTPVNFIIGFPSETPDEIDETLSLIEELKENNPNMESPFLNIYTPYPGTKLFGRAVELGFNPPQKLADWSEFNWNNVGGTYINKDLLTKISKLSNEYLAKVNYPI